MVLSCGAPWLDEEEAAVPRGAWAGGSTKGSDRGEVSGKPAGAGVSSGTGLTNESSFRSGSGPVGVVGAAGALRSERGPASVVRTGVGLAGWVPG